MKWIKILTICLVLLSINTTIAYAKGNKKPKKIYNTTSNKKSNGVTLRQDQLDLLLDLQRQGLITLEPKLHSVYVETGLWESMRYQLKADFAASLATYCANNGGYHAYWVKILDKYSGEKIGEFSDSFGLKVY